MSRKRRSTNIERKAKAQQRRLAREQEDRHEEYRRLTVDLHREWRERDKDDLTPGVCGDEDESAT